MLDLARIDIRLLLRDAEDVLASGPYRNTAGCELLLRNRETGELTLLDSASGWETGVSLGTPATGWAPVGVGRLRP